MLYGLAVLTFRFSTSSDWGIIFNLLKHCFGFKHSDWDGSLDGRYYMAFDGDNLIAVTGINDTGLYKGLEVDWTCVSPSYRGNNLISIMLKDLLRDVDTDVYCSCWRVLDRSINLHNAMSKCGFTLIQKQRSAYGKGWYYACDECVYSNIDGCRCYEDLYVRRYKEVAE